MTKRILPIQKIVPQDVEVGGSIQVHSDRLASFKTMVSRYKREAGNADFKLEYSGTVNNYVTATRIL